MTYKGFFTSESVGAGHPDKICDQISDAILDFILANDANARVAIEVMATNRLIVIGGEVKTNVIVNYQAIVKRIVMQLGYFENDFTILTNVNEQSPDISQGVDQGNGQIGAGDQGLIFGYASNETPEYMPLSIVLAHKLASRAEHLRLSKSFPYAKADLKTQVTIDYHHQQPRIDTILMSVQHDANYDEKIFKNFIVQNIMLPIAKEYGLNEDFKTLINPTGSFVIGGPFGDTGLTGRKIIVDSYGGKGHHGGGAFSGKDYTKVDRSGAYMARYVAKNLVAAGVARELEIQIAYAIGRPEPVSIAVETFSSTKISDEEIIKIINELFDFTPLGIIATLNLKRPIYEQVATFGHFGRTDLDLPWEKLDKVAKIRQLLTTLKC